MTPKGNNSIGTHKNLSCSALVAYQAKITKSIEEGWIAFKYLGRPTYESNST